MKTCFILGIQKRSGTNYLFQLLRKHKDCIGPGPIWEDFLLYHSDRLTDYTRRAFAGWNPDWEIEKQVGSQSELLKCFGNALIEFLQIQVEQKLSLNSLDANSEEVSDSNQLDSPKILLTKTPSVKNIKNFFRLFPDSYLILLVRDGRSVVESGVQSFGWDYDYAIQEWASGAENILRFKNENKDFAHHFLIIKYEDLVQNEPCELQKIFNFLGLSSTNYDFTEKSTGVVGSSELGKIDWQTRKKPENFNPLSRFSHWDVAQHQRFNWLAGSYMEELGYILEYRHDNHYKLRNKLLNVRRNLHTKLYKLARNMLLQVNLIIHTPPS